VEQLGQQVIRIVPRRVRPQDFAPALRTQLLVLQPTPFCNLDCSYCYLPQRDDRSRMSLATVRLAARRLREDGLLADELTVVWHAGEPTVLPPAWYEAAFAAVADELGGSTRLGQAMQTNATLIDADWCGFFLRHGVSLGVSVDGPAALHDRHRRTRGGQGTHARVLRGMACLRAHGVPFHAIAVVGAHTLPDPDGFYDWFEAQGITELGCNFDEAEGGHARSSLQGHEAAHASFLQRLLERSTHGRVAVRELAAAWRALAAPLPRWRWSGQAGHDGPQNSQAMPLALVSVAHDGRWCTFSPELLGQRAPAHGDFMLGNVHDGGYVQALAGARFAALWGEIARGLAACAAACDHFEHCGGGAPANKFYEHGHFAATETLHCRSMVQRPFDAVLRRAEAELKRVAA
jgi:uncharacterized protein